MKIHIYPESDAASLAAADLLGNWLADPRARTIMVAAGNTPLDLYRRIAARRLPLSHLLVFALDEYAGVPPDEPRNCANLLRHHVAEAWGVPGSQFFAVSPLEQVAPARVREHERRIAEEGGLDVVVLGLGQNGHLGFNEPGSRPDSEGRVVDLEPTSVDANRRWFGGDYAPTRGVTVGMRTILAARRILLMAYGAPKAAAARAMIEGPRAAECPASWLQGHAGVHVSLDEDAAAGLGGRGR